MARSTGKGRRPSIVGERWPIFWAGCAAISAGVALHLPMLAMAHRMGNHLAGMPMDGWMYAGMALILFGVPAAIFGVLPKHRVRHDAHAGTMFEAPDDTPFGRWHAAVLFVLTLGLIIDTMKPATLGFVLPGMRHEYGIPPAAAALLPFVALLGTTVGSFIWGWLADIYGRRVSILLSTILFVSTSICGAMPSFAWNLVMCFLMGCSAGGMLPVVYTLLAEVMPPRSRSWVLVLVGGTGLVGGYLAASGAAHLFEPAYGWRSLWLQGFPTGLLLLALARWIPESPRFLLEQGREDELAEMGERFGIVRRRAVEPEADAAAANATGAAPHHRRLTGALVITALSWSFVTFGLLLWLPSDLQARGYSAELASGIIASSALIALPTIMIAAWLYSRWSSKWTLVLTIVMTLAGLAGALLPAQTLASPPLLISVIAMLVVGSNGMIAVLLPYAAENYPLGVRGRATGLIAASSKFGGVAVQGFALIGLIPTLGGAAFALLLPMAASAVLVGYVGRETRGRSLRELEAR